MSPTGEPTGLEVAIVGMAGRFPGAASVAELWDLVRAGRVAIARFDAAELDAAGVPTDLRERADFVPAGGVVDDADRFDGAFFGYSPRDAALLDPQQRLFLECAWHALEEAGLADPARAHPVGVFAGSSLSTYLLRHLLPNPGLMTQVTDHDLILSNDKDTLATRVAYHLNLTGPAVTVQTACSTSLVAVHLAVQALLAGDCDAALAGGVSVRLPQQAGYRHTVGGILSPEGRCLPFDARADGVVGGNGVAAVVLKRLADAVRDGDPIHAVIRGSAVNNDGATKVGFTAPGVDGQAAVIRAAHQVAAVPADSIGYVEAHGTGTALGDPIEVAALAQAFTAAGSPPRPGSCALASVKALLGHLDAAAGVTGLIVAALAVRDGVLPPSPYFERPNPELGLDGGPFALHATAREWPPGRAGVRRAGVSGFGMGGTNAHVVLEQPPVAAVGAGSQTSAPAGRLLLVSARDGDALADARRDLADLLAAPDAPPLQRVAYTTQTARAALGHRCAVVAADPAEAVGRLRTGTPEQVGCGVPGTRDDAVVLLFPGQGAQYPGMGRGLYEREPAYRAAVDECAELLRPHLGADIRALLHADAGALDQTRLTQPALFTVEYALATMLRDFGVRIGGMLGHSVGEYVAASLAGTMSLPDAVALVAARGALMQALPPGAMLAVRLPADELADELADKLAGVCGGGVAVAAANAPSLSVASGPVEAIDALGAALERRGVTAHRLRTSHAFHSPMVDPMLAEFTARVAAVPLAAPDLPFVSNVTGDWITAAQATDPGYWARHARGTVRFSDGLRRLLGGGSRILVECGPGTTLASLVRQHPLPDGTTVTSAMRHPKDPGRDDDALLGAVGRMWVAGAGLDFERIWAGRQPARVALPGYPFRRTRHWYDLPTGTPAPSGADAANVGAAASVEPPAAALAGTEERIARIWRELLGVPALGRDSDFFTLGGHSMLATQILARMRDEFGVLLPPGAIFAAPTVARLADLVEAARAEGEPPGPDPDLADILAEIQRLTPEQLHEEIQREHRGEGIRPA